MFDKQFKTYTTGLIYNKIHKHALNKKVYVKSLISTKANLTPFFLNNKTKLPSHTELKDLETYISEN